MIDVTIFEDNGGNHYISDDSTMWESDYFTLSRAEALQAAEAWQSGEWEPNAGDGWREAHIDETIITTVKVISYHE